MHDRYLPSSSSHPHDSSIQRILVLFVNINLYTRCEKYGLVTDAYHTKKGEESTPVEEPFHLHFPVMDGIPNIPKLPLCRIMNNPNS